MEHAMHLICPKPKPRIGERWTHVHVPTPVSLEEIPDDNADVFQNVSDIEEDILEQTNLNLNGKFIMTKNTLASALVSAGIVHSLPAQGHNYFDPLDVLEDHIGQHAVMHSRVLNSMAWMMDTACINQARTVLFTRYADCSEPAEEDPFNEFCQGIAEDLSHDSHYSSEEDSNEKTLAVMLALRNQWHDAAQKAASADDKDYNPKSLHELLLAEKPRTANIGTRTNYEAIATMESKGDEAMKARLLAAYIQADALNAAQRAEGSKKLIPTISIILDTVGRYAPAAARFDSLPHAVQRRMAQLTIKTVDRVKLDVAKVLASQTILFGRVIEAAYKCTEALNTVLATKYTEAGEMEYAGMPPGVINYDRNQKRIASTNAS
jgi:phage terminase Nu1 subunit (DNA packaging protein)